MNLAARELQLLVPLKVLDSRCRSPAPAASYGEGAESAESSGPLLDFLQRCKEAV